jgi:hypothetical protein
MKPRTKGILALTGRFTVGDETFGNLNGHATGEPIIVRRIVARKAWARWLRAHLDAEGVRLAEQRIAWDIDRGRPITYAAVEIDPMKVKRAPCEISLR